MVSISFRQWGAVVEAAVCGRVGSINSSVETRGHTPVRLVSTEQSAAAAYAARGWRSVFHGLTPTATCCRRFAARLESPGWRPGGFCLGESSGYSLGWARCGGFESEFHRPLLTPPTRLALTLRLARGDNEPKNSYPLAVLWVRGEPRMRRLAWVTCDKVA